MTDEDDTSTDPAPRPGDLRVWHVPQVPGPAFKVRVVSVTEGLDLVRCLCRYDEFQLEENIKPDFFSASGIERYEEDGEGGYDWFEVDLEEDEEEEVLDDVIADTKFTEQELEAIEETLALHTGECLLDDEECECSFHTALEKVRLRLRRHTGEAS